MEKQSEKEFSGLKEAKEKEKVKRAVSEPSLVSRESTSTPSGREKHRHRRTKRSHKPRPPSRFGYEIADLDAYLTKVSTFSIIKNETIWPLQRYFGKYSTSLGFYRETCQYSRGPLVSIRPVPDSRWYSRRDGSPSWNSGECCIQEPNLAIRSNSTRPGRVRRVRSLSTIGDITATNQRTLLGGLNRRISSSLR